MVWLSRLLKRLGQNKESRWIPWKEDLQEHLQAGLADEASHRRPSNVPAGFWYWVSPDADSPGAFYLLIMMETAKGPAPAEFAETLVEIGAALQLRGFESMLVRAAVSAESYRHMHWNTVRPRLRTSNACGLRRTFRVARFHVRKP